MLSELIDLLTCGDLDVHEREQVAKLILDAPENPELDWADNASQAMSFELYSCLADHVATGERIDEVHEQLQAMFAEPLSDLPPTMADAMSRRDYFEWLDAELSRRAVDRGGYGVVTLDDMASDTLYVFIVYRANSARVFELARSLGLRFKDPRAA